MNRLETVRLESAEKLTSLLGWRRKMERKCWNNIRGFN